MVISPYSVAVSPYTMPPCSCASICPTFTVGPQSTAHTTRCTRTDPSGPAETSAPWAQPGGSHAAMAIPPPRRGGGGDPPPACFAASSSVRRWRLVVEQLAPQLEGILAGRRRHLVEEALGDERVLRDPHRAPEAQRHGQEIGRHLIHQQVGDGVREIRRAVDERAVDALVERAGLEEDGRRDDAVRPRQRGAGRIEAGSELVVGRGAIEAVLHVVFP